MGIVQDQRQILLAKVICLLADRLVEALPFEVVQMNEGNISIPATSPCHLQEVDHTSRSPNKVDMTHRRVVIAWPKSICSDHVISCLCNTDHVTWKSSV